MTLDSSLATLIAGDFPSVRLRAPDGAHAQIYLYGGHVTSWNTPDSRERLFMSRRAEFRPGASLRGGVPVIFPQFAGLGPLLKHGFARVSPWEYQGADANSAGVTARFRLTATDDTRRHWDHDFQLDLAVTAGGPALALHLEVTNTDREPFDFTAALHTYLRVGAIGDVAVEGLEGLPYREHGRDAVQNTSPLRIEGEIDRIYWRVPGPVTVRDAQQTLRVDAAGFPDVVVWNPGPVLADALADLEPGGYRHMLCVEAAVIGRPVALAPGQAWRGTQTITARQETP